MASRDRNLTEKRILEAVGKIVEAEGFEAVGVNAVANVSGVSKVLIYRYFGSIEQLLAKYLEDNDFWLNTEFPAMQHDNVKEFSKTVFRAYIDMLRKSPALRKLYRWELSTNNPAIEKLRERREQTAMGIINAVSQMSGQSLDRVAGISTLITASVSYLCVLSENCGVFNSLEIDNDSGWDKLLETIDFMFDKIFS
ncbi:MAG: TetR/AcrR family transcriptional regulator [Salinivirgaceae bacterium]|nr:TetR/AcrR family transcriptional regulator [Salinivirgaceae bacterium]